MKSLDLVKNWAGSGPQKSLVKLSYVCVCVCVYLVTNISRAIPTMCVFQALLKLFLPQFWQQCRHSVPYSYYSNIQKYFRRLKYSLSNIIKINYWTRMLLLTTSSCILIRKMIFEKAKFKYKKASFYSRMCVPAKLLNHVWLFAAQ